jgi:predicted Zn-dependent peptidase
VPLVQVNILVDAGSVRDDPARPGLASLTADMLDEGAAGRSALEVSEAFEALGARFSTGAGAHQAVVSLRVPVARLADALTLVAEVLLRPDFPAEELERKRTERITALIRQHDNPNAIASALFDRVVYGEEHPYGRPALGTEASLRAFDVAAVRTFYERYYSPANATAVVVGDISPDAARAAIEAAFSMWSGAAVPDVTIPAAPARTGRTLYLVDKPGSAQSTIIIGGDGVGRRTPDYAALEVLNTALGGSFTSRLNQNLREDKGYTYGARSSFDYGVGTGAFSAQAAVQTDATAPAITEFLRELEGIRAPMASEELARSRNFLAMSYPGRFQSVAAVAGRIAELVQYDLPDDTFSRWVGQILSVEPPSVTAVADARIHPDRMAIVVVGDRSRIEAGIRALGLGELVVLSVADVLGPVPARPGS